MKIRMKEIKKAIKEGVEDYYEQLDKDEEDNKDSEEESWSRVKQALMGYDNLEGELAGDYVDPSMPNPEEKDEGWKRVKQAKYKEYDNLSDELAGDYDTPDIKNELKLGKDLEGRPVVEVTPTGKTKAGKPWEKVVKAIKKSKSAKNPWAIAHAMKSKQKN